MYNFEQKLHNLDQITKNHQSLIPASLPPWHHQLQALSSSTSSFSSSWYSPFTSVTWQIDHWTIKRGPQPTIYSTILPYFKAIPNLKMMVLCISTYKTRFSSMWTFLPDPQHGLNLEPCHLKLHDTSFFIWKLFAIVWIKASINMDIGQRGVHKKLYFSIRFGQLQLQPFRYQENQLLNFGAEKLHYNLSLE